VRVLVLHSRYLSGPVSGENRVVDDEVELLRQAGHDVVAWTPTVGDSNHRLRTAANAIWSRQEAANVRQIVIDQRPEIVHVHSLYPRLSPSVIRTASKLDVPIVMTLHNFRLMCLPATFLRDGAPCEACAGHVPWRGVVHGCYRGSRPASAALAASLSLHRAASTFGHVDLFLAVSSFVRDKYVRNGIDHRRIRLKDNFSWPLPRRDGAGAGFLILGRLSPEKGVDTAIAATPPPSRLTVVGEGPERHRLEALAPANVRFVDSVEPAAVPAYLAAARALLVPSRCYEGAPRSIIEAFAAGVPVIASRTGGLSELVEDNVNGLLVPPDDVRAWRAAVARLLDDGESERLGRGAYECWQKRFSPSIATRRLEHSYAAAGASGDLRRSRGQHPDRQSVERPAA
jgi:glycosyltransferase involved in cell wall biosynthesis